MKKSNISKYFFEELKSVNLIWEWKTPRVSLSFIEYFYQFNPNESNVRCWWPGQHVDGYQLINDVFIWCWWGRSLTIGVSGVPGSSWRISRPNIFVCVCSFLLVSRQEKKCSRRKQKVAAHYDKSIICFRQTWCYRRFFFHWKWMTCVLFAYTQASISIEFQCFIYRSIALETVYQKFSESNLIQSSVRL